MYDLLETTCIVWGIGLGFFIFLTIEVILVVGIIFSYFNMDTCKERYV